MGCDQTGLAFEPKRFWLSLTRYTSLDKLLYQWRSQLETDGILKLGNLRGLIKGLFIKVWEHTRKPQEARSRGGLLEPRTRESCVERPLGRRTCDLSSKGPVSPERLYRQGVRRRNTPTSLSCPTHVKKQIKDNNYLTFLSLIFLICERGIFISQSFCELN